MKKNYAILFFFLISQIAKADEGMWLASLLHRNYDDMKKHGLHLSAEQIYSINNASLKDAVVSLGGFCTAEVVSKNGLLLTNHHCGYDAIADASNAEHNYLKDGFWAKEYSQEVEVPDLTATFIVRIEDVSEMILKELNDSMTEEERNDKIAEISKKITEEITNKRVYSAYVRDFFEGNEFYLFVTQTFNDIRLVGAPPSSIGKFGYDTDNWVWPRHTGDFSMFRIYADKDNKPSEYSNENVPYSPKYALPISLKGVHEGDFSMILGFPGSTDRYLSSFGVKQAMNVDQPKRVELRKIKLDIMKKYMDADETVSINYASKYAQIANYWKYFIGQSEQLKNNHVVDKKQALEAQFKAFAQNNEKYKNIISNMEESYQTLNKYTLFEVFVNEAIFSVDVNLLAYRFIGLENAINGADNDLITANIINLKNETNSFFEKANFKLLAEVINEMYSRYYREVPREQQAEFWLKIGDKNHGNFTKYVDLIQKKSIFFNQEKMNTFLETHPIKTLQKDPLFVLIKQLLVSIRKTYQIEEYNKAQNNLSKQNRLFVEGLREMLPHKIFYPNANSTLRLTYGNILPYQPKDAVEYDYRSTIKGIFEKETIGMKDYIVPEKLKELSKNKDFGEYIDKDGNMYINFLSNNDITGGNSGSPVINGDGQLIGIAFDGNWEAMSGDIYFEPELQRTISVDIRYVLFIIDKYANASNLIREMEIIQ